MDSLISAAARALAAGDPLGALKRVALREDPPALALRGIAMAQLGEHPRARELLRRAAQGFGTQEAVAHARCVVAEAEVALAMRDLGGTPRALAAAADTLEGRGDIANALRARLIGVRRWLLLGRLDEAASTLNGITTQGGPPALVAVAELTAAELALRSLKVDVAQAALDRAQQAATRAGVPALLAEVAETRAVLQRPAARRLGRRLEQKLGKGDANHDEADGEASVDQPLRLAEIAALQASGVLLLDACRRGLRRGADWLPLSRRPVLFSLAQALAEAWPGDADRHGLIEQAFRTREPDETHRARLRVEIGRLRKLAAGMVQIEATSRGFVLKPHADVPVVVLAPPIPGEQASLLALLADGAAWSTSALALALDASQRTVQRALAELEADGRVRAIGRARAQRWLAPPLAGFTTILLLPAALPAG